MFSETMSAAANLADGFGLTVLGMGVVFAILAVLSFALDALRVLLADKEKESAGSVSVSGEKAPNAALHEDDEALVAVITAAIAAFSEMPADSVVVKSIRQMPQTGFLWRIAGRIQIMAERL
jgi:sodium pump decarboxylase gamma subunit